MSNLAYQEKYTANDHSHWKGDWELIYGDAYAMVPSPMVTHQLVSSNIVYALKNAVSNCSDCMVLSEIDYEVSTDTVLRPDVVLICKPIDEKLNKTPEIIFEVLSASTTRRDETVKFDIYQREGVAYYVLVNPLEKIAKVYRLADSGSYIKQGDFSDDFYHFDISICTFDLNFSTIWRR
ncbi:MAG: hypothetical protein COB07_01275 [Sulfurovum sp.]|nr:MAG: hypothetical protein COB07_01275 [Sulfurovum sp.]